MAGAATSSLKTFWQEISLWHKSLLPGMSLLQETPPIVKAALLSVLETLQIVHQNQKRVWCHARWW
jgi:hypothetical protein